MVTKIISMNSIRLFLFQVVFVGPFEHHSNILPWKETGTRVNYNNGKNYMIIERLKLRVESNQAITLVVFQLRIKLR